MSDRSWHARTVAETSAALGTGPSGLSAEEAARRLAQYGPNELKPPTPASILSILIDQVTSVVVWLLAVAALISWLLGDRIEAAAIAGVLVINTARALHGLSGEALNATIARTGVFSRVTPEDKLTIVRTLQQHGEIVAMLGDGVNDAAALRKADVGVAMGMRGTEVAKEAASIVLQDDRFETIAAAVEEGRVVFDNIRKFVFYLFTCNLAEILVLLVAGLIGVPMALLPLQLLWLAALGWALAYAPEKLTTMVFMTLAGAQIFHLGNARSSGHVLTLPAATANPAAIGAVLLSVGLQLSSLLIAPLASVLRLTPLGWREWTVVVLLSVLPGAVGQVLKVHRHAACF
jgi:Ca2+-transporting ATPase